MWSVVIVVLCWYDVCSLFFVCELPQVHRIWDLFPNITTVQTSVENLSSYSNDLPNLTELALDWRMRSAALVNRAVQKCQNLRRLQFGGRMIREKMSEIPALFSLSSLSLLTIATYELEVGCLPQFSRLCSLKALNFYQCFFPESLRWFNFGKALAKTPLQRLSLSQIHPAIHMLQVDDLLKAVELRYLFIECNMHFSTFKNGFSDPNNPRGFSLSHGFVLTSPSASALWRTPPFWDFICCEWLRVSRDLSSNKRIDSPLMTGTELNWCIKWTIFSLKEFKHNNHS